MSRSVCQTKSELSLLFGKGACSSMAEWRRLDVLLMEREIFSSRKAALSAIMNGFVLVDGTKITKAGKNVSVLSKIELIPSFKPSRYVSRGGIKLEKALSEFAIDVSGQICLDIGASTGGFTDCLLQHKAKTVYAIDVGYGQFDWALRNDSRVVLKERQNVRYMTKEELYGLEIQPAYLAVVDVSFISLTKVLSSIVALLDEEEFEMICLIKPQFEAGKNLVGKRGVVQSKDVHTEVIKLIIGFAAELNLVCLGLTYSPLVGPAGNIEFLLHLAKSSKKMETASILDVRAVVDAAHHDLRQGKATEDA
jgi:23S rRNA (cytidine1920-2'-O)/16S rRNA (cytidine1409-2'-O)-methyltransferase